MEQLPLQESSSLEANISLVQILEVASSEETKSKSGTKEVNYVVRFYHLQGPTPGTSICFSVHLGGERHSISLDKKTGKPHYLGKSGYRWAVTNLNRILSDIEKKGNRCYIDCSRAPSLSPEDLVAPASAYAFH